MGLGWFVSGKTWIEFTQIKVHSFDQTARHNYIHQDQTPGLLRTERNLSSHFFPERNGTKIELIRENTVLTETKWFLFYLKNADTTKVTFFKIWQPVGEVATVFIWNETWILLDRPNCQQYYA